MRDTAVRRSVTWWLEGFMAAEFARLTTRAASIGSAPTIRTTISVLTASSASTCCTRSATSGKLGSSIGPADSAAASSRTNAKPGAFGLRPAWMDSLLSSSGRAIGQRLRTTEGARIRSMPWQCDAASH